MAPPRKDRTPERTEGIAVELTEFGLWIEVHDQPGGWQGVFLSARALRRLAAMAPEQRLAALAALDPARPATGGGGRRRQPTAATTDQPPSTREGRGREWGAQPLGLGGAPSLHHHKE
jgi:hypothetical protein